MKAAIVEKPGRLTVRDIAAPQVGPYDALCRLLYGATCTGTDQHLIYGRFPWPVQYPTILGHESIGRVLEVGQSVRHLKPGDLVTRVGTPPPPNSGLDANWGGFAELGIARDYRAMREDGLPETEWRPFAINQLLPPETDPAAATMMITWRETWSYISRMGVGRGSRVLVSGSGGNGLAFIAHARNLGASQIALVGHDGREDLAKTLGATDFCSYKDPDVAGSISACCTEGFDYIIDAVGKKGQLDVVLPCLKPGGSVTIYGLDDHGSWTIDISRARGTFIYYVGGYDEAEVHEDVLAMLQDGRLNAAHWLDLARPFPLENINEAFAAVQNRSQVKALIRLTPE